MFDGRLQVGQPPTCPVAAQVNPASTVHHRQAEALIGLWEFRVAQDALPGGHGSAQRGRVAGLEVTGLGLLGAAEVSLEFRGDLGCSALCTYVLNQSGLQAGTQFGMGV